jgi:hypothetical protein
MPIFSSVLNNSSRDAKNNRVAGRQNRYDPSWSSSKKMERKCGHREAGGRPLQNSHQRAVRRSGRTVDMVRRIVYDRGKLSVRGRCHTMRRPFPHNNAGLAGAGTDVGSGSASNRSMISHACLGGNTPNVIAFISCVIEMEGQGRNTEDKSGRKNGMPQKFRFPKVEPWGEPCAPPQQDSSNTSRWEATQERANLQHFSPMCVRGGRNETTPKAS